MQYIHNQSNISEAFDFEQLDANDIISQPSNFAIYSITPYIVSLLTEFLSATEIKCLNPVKGITEFYPDIIPGMPAAVVKSNVVLYTGFSCSRGDYYIQLEDIKCFNVFKTCGTIVSDEEILDKLRLEFNHIFMSPTLQRQYLDAYKVYQRITENISIDTIIKLYNAYIPSKYRFSTTFILSHDCISYKVGYNNNDIMCECVPNLPEEYLDPDDTASVIIGLTGANIPDICKTSYNTITEAFDFNEVDDMVSDTPYNTDDARRLYADGLDIRPVIPEYFNIKPLSGTSVYRLKELSYYPALIKPMINYCSRATDTINNLVHEKWIHILGEYYDAYVYLCDNPEATIDELKSLYPEPENRTVAEVIRTNLQIVLYGFHQIFDVAPEACDVVPIIIKGCSCGNMLNTAMDGYIGTYTMALDDIYISPDCAVYYFKNLKNYVNKNLVPEKGDYIVCVGLTGYNIPECCKKNHKKPISEAFDFNDVEDSLSDSPYDSMYVKNVYSGTLDIRPVLPAVFNLKDITGATVYRPEELGGFPALIKPMGTAHSTISKAIDSIARTNNGWFCVLGLYYQAHEYLNNHPDATLEDLINLYSSLQFKGMYIASGFKSDLENILDTYKKITAITNGDYEFILNILKEYSCNVDLPENKHQHIRAISRLRISPDCSIYYFYADGYSTRADLRNGKYYLMCIGLTGHNIPEYCHAQPKKKVSRVKEAHEVTVLKRMMAKANISAASIADVEYGIFSDGRPYCVITGEKYYKSSGSCKMANAAKDKIRYNMASIYSRGMD